MWPDNETERDFLNFSGVADTVAEIIVQARGRPISIGVSGAWGIGKSSMIKLRDPPQRPRKEGERDFVFVEFNAWLYQGYDDARAALMDVIAHEARRRSRNPRSAIDKVKSLGRRIKWLRAAKLAATQQFPCISAFRRPALIGELVGVGKPFWSDVIARKLLMPKKESAR